MSQYKVAMKVVNNVSIAPLLISKWNLDYAKAMEAFAVYCRYSVTFLGSNFALKVKWLFHLDALFLELC